MSKYHAAKVLDQLMGPSRNLPPAKNAANGSKMRHWSDEDVCKNYLAGLCPNELFILTKNDMGTCSKNHSDVLKEDYENSKEYGTMGYEEALFRLLKHILSDCDRRVEQSVGRLQLNKAKSKDALEKAEVERQAFLDSRIEHCLAKIEALGTQGKVDEAKEVAAVIEKLKFEKTRPPDGPSTPYTNYLQDKAMEVCEICGSLILCGDLQARIDDHNAGRLHAGYAKVREAHAKMLMKYWVRKSDDNNPVLDVKKSSVVVEKEKKRERPSEKKSKDKKQVEEGEMTDSDSSDDRGRKSHRSSRDSRHGGGGFNERQHRGSHKNSGGDRHRRDRDRGNYDRDDRRPRQHNNYSNNNNNNYRSRHRNGSSD